MNDDRDDVLNGNQPDGEIPAPVQPDTFRPSVEASPVQPDGSPDAEGPQTVQINVPQASPVPEASAAPTENVSPAPEAPVSYADPANPIPGQPEAPAGYQPPAFDRPEAPAANMPPVSGQANGPAQYTQAPGQQPPPIPPQELDMDRQYRTRPPQYTGQYRQPDPQYYPRNAQPGYDPFASGHPYPYANEPEGAYAYAENRPEKSKAGSAVLIALLSVILLGVLVVVGLVVFKGLGVKTDEPGAETNAVLGESINMDPATTDATPINPGTAAEGLKSPIQIYKEVLPSSVGILVYSGTSRSSLYSEGSGIIFQEDNDGKYTYIITCAHVISGTGRYIVVQLYDETEYEAHVVGYDNRTDIGVIRIEAHGLKTITTGDSTKLQVGETIYAIGNPGGTEFANTFTNGIVTALDRPVSSSSSGYTMECIQHNAAINPGNSGGALVNEYGQLIGINSMKIVAADYEGMGFAVPSSVFVDVFNSLIERGYVANRPKVGISYLRASDEQVYGMFVAMNKLPAGSIIVAEIAEDSDFKDKLKRGDLITAINGADLSSATDVAAMVEQMKVGDTITFTVVRIHTDYSYDTLEISGTLVEDKQTYTQEEEPSDSSSFDDYFGQYFDDPDFGLEP